MLEVSFSGNRYVRLLVITSECEWLSWLLLSRNECRSVWFDVWIFLKELEILVSSEIPFVHLKCWLFLKCCKSQTDVVEQIVTCKLLYGCLLLWMQGQLKASLAYLIHLSHESTDVAVNQRVHLMFCCLEVYITSLAPTRENWLKVCRGRTYIHSVPCCPILS